MTSASGEPRIQTIAVMVDILRDECLDQAAQARRYGRPTDEADWRALSARVSGIVTEKEVEQDALEQKTGG